MKKLLNNRYEIIKEIGSGGMATVYLAHCRQLDRDVAIKMLHDTDDELEREVFTRESKAIARLSHKNIVQVFDVFEEDHLQYIVMEYIHGTSLKKIIRDREEPFDENTVIKMAIQLVKALAHAHEKGVIHSDIKPDNIIVNEYLEPRITDFGIAKITMDGSDKTKQLYGSVNYASPEQVNGNIVDLRTDIYSLGVVLYELLTNKLPFPDGTEEVKKFKQNNLPIIHPVKTIDHIRPEFAQILDKMLQGDKEARYQTMYDVLNDLEKLQDNPTVLIDPAYKVETSQTKKDNMYFTALLGILLAIITALLLFFPLRSMLLPKRIVEVPNIVETDVEVAKEFLNEKGLYLVVDRAEYSSEYRKGIILEQTPNQGEINHGESIRVTVSKGVEQTTVPQFRERKLEDLTEFLESNKLVLGQVVEEYDAEVAKGYIISQSLPVGTTVDAKSSIDFVVSKGAAPEMTVVPNIVGRSLTDAKTQLSAVGLIIKEISHEFSDEYEKNQVISQSITANTSVEKQTGIDVVISDGPDKPEDGQTIEAVISLPLNLASEQLFTVIVEETYDGNTTEIYNKQHNRDEGVINIVVQAKNAAKYKVYFNNKMIKEGVIEE